MSTQQRAILLMRKMRWYEASLLPLPPLPTQVVFKPTFSLPKLDSYKGTFKASYWAKWRKRNITQVNSNKSWVSAKAI